MLIQYIEHVSINGKMIPIMEEKEILLVKYYDRNVIKTVSSFISIFVPFLTKKIKKATLNPFKIILI